MSRMKTCIALACLALAALTPPAEAQVPVEIRTTIVLRALSEAEGLVAGEDEGVRFVVYRSSRERARVLSLYRRLPRLANELLPGRGHSFSAVDSLAQPALEAAGPSALFATALTDEEAAQAGRAARALGFVVVCDDPASVGRGCTMSVERDGIALRLVIDRAAAEASGVSFSPRVYASARVVGG